MGSPDKGRLLEAKTILMPEGNSLPETAKSLGQQWLHHEPENFRVLTEKAEEMAQRLGPHYPCPLPHPQHLTQVPDSPWLLRHRKFPRAEPLVSLPKLRSARLSTARSGQHSKQEAAPR